MSAFRLVCAGCGAVAPTLDGSYPFRCPRADSLPGTDHVVTKVLDDDAPEWPGSHIAAPGSLNPFIHYRRLLYSYDSAPARGHAERDGAFIERVRELDDAVFEVTGQRFRDTPFGRNDALGRALGFSNPGGLWIKDETGNVSGSHKSRHLAGIMLYLRQHQDRHDLAIASCGNAALAAAVVARAARWPLRAFVPPGADAAVLERLRHLGATIAVCPRRPGEAGDPCYLRFKEALAAGARPFCCQGPDNGLTIEGGETLAYEMADATGETPLDAIVVQVGGGALASASTQGFERAVALGRLPRPPRLYTVQTKGAAPLARAYKRVVARAATDGIAAALSYAATHRSEFMWPWENEPRSVAHGILDDETYDWLAVVKGMLETGGDTVIVDERTLEDANVPARALTGINVDHTGSAGLAGLLSLRASGKIGPDERVAVIFSGVRRS